MTPTPPDSDDTILSWPGGTPPPDARTAKPADQPVEILARQPRTGRTDVLVTVPVGWSRTITVSVPDRHRIEAMLGDGTQELVRLRAQVAAFRALLPAVDAVLEQMDRYGHMYEHDGPYTALQEARHAADLPVSPPEEQP